MATLSMFYGIIVKMNKERGGKHHCPHIHVGLCPAGRPRTTAFGSSSAARRRSAVLTMVIVVSLVVAADAAAPAWPLVTMRHMSATSFDEPTMRALIAIDSRHPKCWDEYWLAEGRIPSAERMLARADLLAGYGEALAAAGIAAGFQQGVTLGHDFTRKTADGDYALPDDAYQLDVDGKATRFHCPRSPAVLAMEELYAETYVRRGRLVSFWLDDDLRLGFYKAKAYACFCDRCVADFNRFAGTSFDRAGLVARLSSKEKDDPLRAVWARFKADSLALFAAAARRGAVRANPQVRLGYQSISSAMICCGEDYHAILKALAGDGRGVGIRPGHGYYAEALDNPRNEIPTKLLDVAREAERCHGYRDLDVNVVYEQENYPHHVMYKTPEACLKEAALSLAVGCDAVSLYWYSSEVPEPLSYYEDYARLAEAWRPYLERVAALSRGTHLGGVAVRADPNLMRSAANTLPDVSKRMPRRNGQEIVLAQYGVPVTVAESGTKAFFRPEDVRRVMRVDERRKLLDAFDAGAGGPLPVRIDKLHALLVYPRTDVGGRVVAVTLLNLSIGRTQDIVLRVRRPLSARATCLRPAEPEVALATQPGTGDERLVALPDLPGWGLTTVSFR